jgi:uncharacterized membrane protein SpoIIM required for sporulation
MEARNINLALFAALVIWFFILSPIAIILFNGSLIALIIDLLGGGLLAVIIFLTILRIRMKEQEK